MHGLIDCMNMQGATSDILHVLYYPLRDSYKLCMFCGGVILFIIRLIFLQQYFPILVLCNITRYCMARVLLHGPWGYAVSKQPRCALIRINAFERRVTWYSVWEETRCCSGMDNKHFITLVSMHIAIISLVGCIFTCLQLVKIPRPLVQYGRILHECGDVFSRV